MRLSFTHQNSSSIELRIARSQSRHFALFFALILLSLFFASLARAIPAVIFNGVVSTVNTGSLDHPQGVAVDLAGNLYVSDTLHNEIIKVTSGGASVLSITGLTPTLNTPSGLAFDAAGNLYIADTGNNRVVEVTPAGAASVVSTGSASLNGPLGIAIDSSGNIFVSSASSIVEIPATGSPSVLNITGLGTPLFLPEGIAVDTFGNLYIADTGNARVVEVNASGVGSVINTNALLTGPNGVAVTRDGVLHIADASGRVVLVNSQGGLSLLLNGTPSLTTPFAIAVSSTGTTYVTDVGTDLVDSLQATSINLGHVQLPSSATASLPFTVGATTTLTSVTSYTEGIPGLDFAIANSSTCVTSFTNGNCSLNLTFTPSAPGLRRGVVVLNFSIGGNGAASITIPVFGFGDAPFAALAPAVAAAINTGNVSIAYPFNTAVDGSGNIYVASIASVIYKIPAGGGTPTTVSTGSLTLQQAAGFAVDPAGNLFVSDYNNNRIVEIPVTGVPFVFAITGLSTPLNLPSFLAFDGEGNLYIDDYGNGRIVEVSPAGQATVLATGSLSLTNYTDTSMAIDPAGDVYIAQRNNNRVIKIDPFGHASTLDFSAVGGVIAPVSVAADANGNIFVNDSGNSRILLQTTSGATSALRFAGATLGTNSYMTVDSGDNLIISDNTNNQLVKIDVSAAALSFSSTGVGSTSSDSPQPATVINLGDQSLVVAATAGFNANFVQNTSAPNSCITVASVAPGASCDVSLSFTPQSLGPLAANILVSDNSRNIIGIMQQIAASGTGIAGRPTIVWTQPNPIVSGTTLAGLLNATATSGGSSVPGTFAYTATAQGGSPVSVTSSTVLAVGNYTLTTTFTPIDTVNFQSVTANVSLAVQDFAFNVSGSGAVTSQTVSRGGTATFSFTLTPSGTAFQFPIALTANGLPAGATATFNPPSISSGAGATNVTLSIQVPATLAANRPTANFLLASGFAPTLIGLAFLPFSRKAKNLVAKNGRMALLCLSLASVGSAAGLAGCGSSTPPASSTTTTPTPQTYNVVVTATSGSSSHSTTLTLTVQ